jgi:hypothetical protein
VPATQYAYRQYAGNGSTTTFAVPFPYLLKAHVNVYTGYDLATGTYTSLLVDGTGYTWTSATQIQTTTAPAAGVTLTVIRQTPSTTQLVQWQDGSNLIASDIDTADKQNLYVVQEQQDKNEATIAIAQSAKTTADSAAGAIGAAGVFGLAANVASIPASPVNGQGVQITDSTGIESFSPLSGLPAGFIGAASLGVRLVFNAGSWVWYGYFSTDPDARYARLTGAAFSGQVQGTTSGGTASPAYAFSGDSDTGLARLGANELALVTNGAARLTFDSSGNAAFAQSVTLPAGSTYGDIASQAEAAAGTSNTKLMTPLATAQAIASRGVSLGLALALG